MILLQIPLSSSPDNHSAPYTSICPQESKVWLEDFAHPDGRTISMTNTNKLIRGYEGCDGGKTGFTNEAGFCIAATAKRAADSISTARTPILAHFMVDSEAS